LVFGIIAGLISRVAPRLIPRVSNVISKVIARSPVSKIPQRVLGRNAGSPVLQSRVASNLPRSRVTRVVKGGRQSRLGRLVTPAIIVGSLGAGTVVDALTGTSGSTAGAIVGGLTPGGRIKKIATAGIGAISGGQGADIAEIHNLGVANVDQPGGLLGVGEQANDPLSNSIIGGSSLLPGGTTTTTRRKTSTRRKKSSTKRSKEATKHVHHKRKVHHHHHKKEEPHKATVTKGLDKVHKTGKKGVSLKMIRAMLKSPNTPPQLKKYWAKKLREKSKHSH